MSNPLEVAATLAEDAMVGHSSDDAVVPGAVTLALVQLAGIVREHAHEADIEVIPLPACNPGRTAVGVLLADGTRDGKPYAVALVTHVELGVLLDPEEFEFLASRHESMVFDDGFGPCPVLHMDAARFRAIHTGLLELLAGIVAERGGDALHDRVQALVEQAAVLAARRTAPVAEA